MLDRQSREQASVFQRDRPMVPSRSEPRTVHRQLAHDGSGGAGCEGQVLPETEVLVRGPRSVYALLYFLWL